MTRAFAHLTGGGCSVVVALSEDSAPYVVHWGAALSDSAAADLVRTASPGVPTSAPDRPRVASLLPLAGDGWAGSPGFAGHREGRAMPPRPSLVKVEHDASRATFTLDDPDVGIGVELSWELDDVGVLTSRAAVSNSADGIVDVAALRMLMPLPQRAADVLDFTGRWSRERSPQRRQLRHGSQVRRAERGRPGHDSPFLTVAGTAGFGFRHGEAWAAHLAWSGSYEYVTERLPEGAGVFASVLGVGEGLAPGEIRLAPGERYDSPAAVFAWSDQGLDGLTERLHAHVRAFDSAPAGPRPITVNSWEAVYFDHTSERLDQLVQRAAAIGAERFVLDDGWFAGRDDDSSSLGDWSVDPRKWPDGLGELSRRIHDLGMQFGLWFEPEMVNLDSDLARAHPEWLLAPVHRPTVDARQQQVLNIAHPDAGRYLFERLSALIAEYGIDYIKWDHNRDLTEAVDRVTGRPGVRRQTGALYALLDSLRAAHPDLEIESCAGGGGRVDLGILSRVQRIWASDTLDPVERQAIQRWTGTLVPPEFVGTHVGAGRAHTTGRRADLSFRLATALFGHAGVEWDLVACTDEDMQRLASWVALAKDVRPLLGRGVTVRADLGDPETLLSAVVEPDGSRALVAWVRLGTSPDGQTGLVPVPGLRDDVSYRVRLCTELGEPRFADRVPPAWVGDAARGGLVVTGEALTRSGLVWPTLHPAQAAVFDLRAIS